MTSVDRYGFEMSATTLEGPRPVRVAFARPVGTPEELRAALVAMVKDARVKQMETGGVSGDRLPG
jgi:putative heme iron utilization protein